MSEYREIRRTFIRLGEHFPYIPCMLYEPRLPDEKSGVMIILEHSDDDYFEFVPAKALAERGYRCMVSHVTTSMQSLDNKVKELSRVVECARTVPGVRKLVLLGHSGGATLMSAYQAAAENGLSYFQGKEKLIPFDEIGELTPADAVMFLDANFGNGAMSLISLDPSVMDEGDGLRRDPSLDLFNPANGFNEKGCSYSDAFIRDFWAAQADRMERLIAYASDRVTEINAGRGHFEDDEPMLIPGGTQFAPCNKLINQLPERFFSHTEGEWDLIHKDGSVSRGIVPCVRIMRPMFCTTAKYHFGALATTVKTFLKSSAVHVSKDYHFDETTLYGVDWDSSYCTVTGNASGIGAPMLIMGMTGSYEYIAAEHIYKRAVKAADKTVAFVEGAGHNFTVAQETEKEPGQYGDTAKSCFDFVDGWLEAKFMN